MNSLSTDK